MFKSPPQIPSPCEWRLRLPLPGHPDSGVHPALTSATSPRVGGVYTRSGVPVGVCALHSVYKSGCVHLSWEGRGLCQGRIVWPKSSSSPGQGLLQPWPL